MILPIPMSTGDRGPDKCPHCGKKIREYQELGPVWKALILTVCGLSVLALIVVVSLVLLEVWP